MSGSSHPRGSELGTPDQVVFGLPNVLVDKGAHLAHFFREEHEPSTVLTPYIRAGLEAGDHCVLVSEAAGSLNCKKTTREIRGTDPGARVVIITGYPNSDLMAEALQVGPVVVMKKPFTLDGIRGYLDVWQAALGMP